MPHDIINYRSHTCPILANQRSGCKCHFRATFDAAARELARGYVVSKVKFAVRPEEFHPTTMARKIKVFFNERRMVLGRGEKRLKKLGRREKKMRKKMS